MGSEAFLSAKQRGMLLFDRLPVWRTKKTDRSFLMKDDNRLSFWFLGACVERLSGECGESLLFFWQIERAQRCVMVGMIKTVTDFMNHFEFLHR
ncbi:hypothetical protein [Geobacillus stearothermophilus]|uniref:hypothetical protein n=1 Tax=Geobacillus stearothermophilus TaxID=1422 RepID=UPI003D1BB739